MINSTFQICSRKSLMTLTLASFLICGCVPTLTNLKEDSDVANQLPKEYPKAAEETPATDGEIPWTESPDNINATTSTDSPKEENAEGSEKAKDGAENAQALSAAPALKQEPVAVEAAAKIFFADTKLSDLIAIAIKNNQEINIAVQEITIANNEIMARKGEYLPKLGIGGGAGLEKVGKFTSQGVSDANNEYEPGKPVPEKLPMYSLGLKMSWELDIWKKLRNATKSAMLRYMASIDGKNFLVTQLVAEIANTYYELRAYDKQLEILQKNIDIQTQALELMRLQQQAARVTSLAVRRFEAEVFKSRSRKYELQQNIVQTENKLNFLTGRLPQPIARGPEDFISLNPRSVNAGVPTELISRRPDVQQAERKLQASRLDVKVARARFYPSLSIEAGAGYQSFNSKHFLDSPDSVFYNIAGNLTAPLLNRMGIKADYFSANSKQIQAVYDYERTVIHAYTEVVNQLSMIDNMQKTYSLKSKQVAALVDALEISSLLFSAARADYVEVLMTRRDALESQMELVEIKKKQLTAYVNLYQALGGGWRE